MENYNVEVTSNRGGRLPSPLYTFFVISLATLFVGLAVIKPTPLIHSAETVIEYPRAGENEGFRFSDANVMSAAAAARMGFEQSETRIVIDQWVDQLRQSIQLRRAPAENPSSDVVVIGFRHQDAELARAMTTALQNEFATANKLSNQTVRVLQPVRLSKSVGGEFSKLQFCLLLGVAMLLASIFAHPSKALLAKNAEKPVSRHDIEQLTGLPVMASVLPSKQTKKPCTIEGKGIGRWIVFLAEWIVVLAFGFIIYNVFTNSEFSTAFLNNPLVTFSRSISAALSGKPFV